MISITEPVVVGENDTLTWNNTSARKLRIATPASVTNQAIAKSGSLTYRATVSGLISFRLLDSGSKNILEELVVTAVEAAPPPPPPGDTTGPVITGPTADQLTESSARISWSLSEPGTG